MDINPNDISPDYRYKILTSCVVPRSVVMVSTISTNGIVNLAPFSSFNIVGHTPMTLLFSVKGYKPNCFSKDSLRNLMFSQEGGTGEFVNNIIIEAYAGAIAKTAASLPGEVSEYALTNLSTVASHVVRPSTTSR